MPYQVTKTLSFCYGHRLLDYEGKCRFLHGHNAAVEVELRTEALDARGMVHDFGDIKAAIGAWLDEELDHRLLLRADDPLLPLLRDQGQPVFAMAANTTAENIARLIFEHGAGQGLPLARVRVWETPTSCATYRP